eukprot:3579735-Prymnesium_polylepis.1
MTHPRTAARDTHNSPRTRSRPTGTARIGCRCVVAAARTHTPSLRESPTVRFHPRLAGCVI